MSLPDTDSLLRLALLAVALYVLLTVALVLLPSAVALVVIVVRLLGAVLAYAARRWRP